MDDEVGSLARGLTRRQFMAAAPIGAFAGSQFVSSIGDLLKSASFQGLSMSRTSLSRMYLSAINWIDGPPAGNRLRWLFPLQKPGAADYLGFPGSFQIDSALLDYYEPLSVSGLADVGMRPRVKYPQQWWERGLEMRAIAPAIFRPRTKHSVQAVTFKYHGPNSYCTLLDLEKCVIAGMPIKDGERLYYESGEIAEVQFLSDNASKISLSDEWVLDLYEPRKLSWKAVAEIAVRTPLVDKAVGDFNAIQTRMAGLGRLTSDHWATLQDYAGSADKIKKPSDDDPTLHSPTWDVWLAMQALLWEISVLTGFGFVHGPSASAVAGDITSDLLHGPLSGGAMIYRVTCSSSGHISNLALVEAGKASDLRKPELAYEPDLVVVLNQVVDDFDPKKHTKPRSIYSGAGTVTWRHVNDPWAMGIDIKEDILPSSILKGSKGSSVLERLHARGRVGLDLSGRRLRSFELDFPDCRLQSTAATVDGWDRISPSTTTDQLKFALRHLPAPPALACATYDYDGNEVKIDRLVNVPECLNGSIAYPDWFPDEIVKHLGGHVEIAQRLRAPQSVPVKINACIALPSAIYDVQLANPLPPGEFVNGRLAADKVSGTITELSADRITVRVAITDLSAGPPYASDLNDPRCAPYSGAPVAATPFVAGPAVAIEDMSSPAFWKLAVSIDQINPLTKQFTVGKGIPLPSDGTDSLVYAARVGFNNLDGKPQFGPYSGPVSALRKSPRPEQPPPFTMEALGRDYYGRLVIALTLSKETVEGRYAIVWALGPKSQWSDTRKSDNNVGRFTMKAVAGAFEAQTTYQGKLLYDVLGVPEPHYSDLYVTVGLKRIDSIGQESPYWLEELLIPAR